MQRLAPLILVLACTLPAYGSGWADYELQIDPGFKIVRANALDVGLCQSDGVVILPTGDHAGVGPIYAYAVTPTHILTGHYGRVPRNLFAGDTLENVDTTKRFFFVTKKSDASVSGPFDEQTFLRQAAVQAAAPVTWTEPSPNVGRRLVGVLFLLMFWLIILGPIVVPLLIAAFGLLLWRRRRRARGRPAAG